MNNLDQLIKKFHKTGILVDANLFILLLIGTYDKNLIGEWKGTAKYSEDDYELLVSFLSRFPVVTLPNILTEVSNLTETLNHQHSKEIFQTFKILVTVMQERQILPSLNAMDKTFLKFGLSDSSIEKIALMGYLVLTDDLKLYHYLISNGSEAINFNHIRQF